MFVLSLSVWKITFYFMSAHFDAIIHFLVFAFHFHDCCAFTNFGMNFSPQKPVDPSWSLFLIGYIGLCIYSVGNFSSLMLFAISIRGGNHEYLESPLFVISSDTFITHDLLLIWEESGLFHVFSIRHQDLTQEFTISTLDLFWKSLYLYW